MIDKQELFDLTRRFAALTQLSDRKNADLLGVSHTTFTRWLRGETGTSNPGAAERMQDVLTFDRNTGMFTDLHTVPAKLRYERLKQFIAGAIR